MALFSPRLLRIQPKTYTKLSLCGGCYRKTQLTSPSKFSLKVHQRSNIRFSSGVVEKARIFESYDQDRINFSSGQSNLTTLARKLHQNKVKGEFFPEVTSKSVAYWLLGSAASVFGIVVFGGLTRLTESGLSITEWRPVSGSLPPLCQADWDSEFEKYRASPEFKILNSQMTLPEFKKIYYMEWGHRLWGRFVGITFVLPATYFILSRKVSLPISLRLVSISGLIGIQGFLGWYMVKSGLKDDLFTPGSHPRVSQYRLAAHLGTAFTCFTTMLWNGLAILRTHTLLSHPARSHAHLLQLSSPALSKFRKSVAILSLLIFTTALSGAFVAGLDAGLIYNQFPSMGDGFYPPKDELLDTFYSRKSDHSDLIWRNMLENPSTVQLDHRILAITTFCAVMSLWAYTRLNPRVRKNLPDAARKGMLSVVHLVLLQVSLGISTLIYLVPTPIAAMHQAGALALLTGVTVLGSRVWIPKRTWNIVRSRLEGSAAMHTDRPCMSRAAFKQIRALNPPSL
ncbi:cytochrome c oxidase assembly protein COX15 [Blumeria hordei DH14]|uniref:Cytochrome c oxidase assembly protein COX15 n=1 Tax=Blumeria graminis f. sp. hordei (strain DH14) TaxID=546991 RepID=N1JNH4_BLUG1|nr:cytochrome c oxidase assembly protein COX15 [Blumeria hordei DH14]